MQHAHGGNLSDAEAAAMKLWLEKILRQYCPAVVNADYDRMAPWQQATLREALYTALKMKMLNDCTKAGGTRTKRTKSKNKHSLLVEALQHLFPHARPEIFHCDQMIENLLYLLSRWGALPPSPAAKILQYQRNVTVQKEQYRNIPSSTCSVTNTSSVISKRTPTCASSSSSRHHHEFRKIPFDDLILFQTSKECYIEGTIVGEAIQPMIGGTTLIQEETTNQVLMVCFYNVLPDGIRASEAEPLLRQEFPIGSMLRVSEPFYKIFGDGQRGIRVDNPREMQVIATATPASSSVSSSFSNLAAAKERGNAFVQKKKYMAATDAYLGGIRFNSDLVATLLSNRAQAHLQLNNHGLAFCDAAASLTIRPNSPKTWARYEKSLAQLRFQSDARSKNTKRQVFHDITQDGLSSTLETVKNIDAVGAERLKQEGNQAFQARQLPHAIELWSRALSMCGETTRACLSNWALCALQLLNFGDAIAATVASLRIGTNDKSLFRLSKALSHLGEYELAQSVLSLLVSTSTTSEEVMELEWELKQCRKYRGMMEQGKAESFEDVFYFTNKTPKCMGNWCGDVETFVSPGKGRGLRATKDLDEGTIVLVEWPLACVETNLKSRGGDVVLANNTRNTINMASSANLRGVVNNRMKREYNLARILDCLSDGSKTNPLVPVSDLLVNLDQFPLLLPTHREYYRNVKDDIEVAADRVDRILNLNSHGISMVGDHNEESSEDTSELYPTVSMMNHASKPNCAFAPHSLSKLCIVITCESIRAGDELFMKYQTDSVVESQWGIKSY